MIEVCFLNFPKCKNVTYQGKFNPKTFIKFTLLKLNDIRNLVLRNHPERCYYFYKI